LTKTRKRLGLGQIIKPLKERLQMIKLRAFISVTNKEGLEKFKRFTDAGHEIISTGGTAKKLIELGIPCTPVEAVTGFPEILEGRVKSMHPQITGGMLGDTKNAKHVNQMALHGIQPFHLVVVNLYDFSGRPGIENIDVGGPTALRSAAKNGGNVAVVMDPEDYDPVLDQLLTDGHVSQRLRERLAMEVFSAMKNYDGAIAEWMYDKYTRGEPLFEDVIVAAH
jgi:phosphoribosylaminoimidazolecarboxamide formyltransferase/IMP cyclohydrolase